MSRKPRIFIASSVEGSDIAYAIQDLLDYFAECTVWDQDVFQPSSTTMFDLVRRVKETDFGIFVFSFEDYTEIRGDGKYTVRDNVLLELGLFTGALGLNRCFIVMPRHLQNTHISTDLLGITTLKYDNTREDDNIKAALGPVSRKIKKQIEKISPNTRLTEELSQQIQNVSLNAFYSNRDDYGKYRHDASTIDSYISTAHKSIVFVGISLSTGMQFDNICNFIKDRLSSNLEFEVSISLLNPNQDELYKSICDVFDADFRDLQNQTKVTLRKLCDVKKRLSLEQQQRFIIKVHKTIPFASAIMLDDALPTGRIQIETKPYKAGMRDSFAMEFKNNEQKFYETLRKSYHTLIDDGDNVENLF